jgi:hypothetical protein
MVSKELIPSTVGYLSGSSLYNTDSLMHKYTGANDGM